MIRIISQRTIEWPKREQLYHVCVLFRDILFELTDRVDKGEDVLPAKIEVCVTKEIKDVSG